ncbi:hypothetical protein FDECE_6932, partial [Fusarium decemcellulare]
MAMLPPCSGKGLDCLILSLRTPTTPLNCDRLLSLSCFRRAETLPGLEESFTHRHPHTQYYYEDLMDALPHDPTLPKSSEAILSIRLKESNDPSHSSLRNLSFSDEPSFQHYLEVPIMEEALISLEPLHDDAAASRSEAEESEAASEEAGSHPLSGQEAGTSEALQDPECITLSDDSDIGAEEAMDDIVEVQSEVSTDAVTKQGLMGQLLQVNSLPVEDLPVFSRLFCLDEATITADTEKKLHGTLKPLRLPQLAFLFRVIMGVRREPSVNGHYLADDVGGGKTIAMLALFVITRYAQLMNGHITSHPHLHLSESHVDGSARCPLGDSFGIQCLFYATMNKREPLVDFDHFLSKVIQPLDEIPFAHTNTSCSSSAQSSPWSGPRVNVYVLSDNPRAENLSLRPVRTRALISPRSIAVDEYHLCYGKDNNINETIRTICRRAQPDSQPRPRVYFLSGTPFQRQAVDLCPTYDIIESDVTKLQAFEHAMKLATREQSRACGERQDNQVPEAVVSGARLISSWMTARARGSPILGSSRIGRHLLPYTLLSMSFSTPGQWQADYRNLIRKARDQLQLQVENRPLNPVTFDGFSKMGSITLLMRGAHCPGLWPLLRSNPDFPWMSQQVWTDLRRDAESLYIRHVDDYVQQDSMFTRLAAIVRDASSGTVRHGSRTYSDQGPFHILLFASFPATAAA